jgi:predicted small metal-binding protein
MVCINHNRALLNYKSILPLQAKRSMKKLLSCREVGCYDDCDYIVTGETEEEVMQSAAEHGIKAHGTTLKDMLEIREKIKEFIHTLAN